MKEFLWIAKNSWIETITTSTILILCRILSYYFLKKGKLESNLCIHYNDFFTALILFLIDCNSDWLIKIWNLLLLAWVSWNPYVCWSPPPSCPLSVWVFCSSLCARWDYASRSEPVGRAGEALRSNLWFLDQWSLTSRASWRKSTGFESSVLGERHLRSSD